MFRTRNGTEVLFVPAYIDHGSTISTSGHYVVNMPMLTKKQHLIGKGTWLLLLKDMLHKTNSTQMKLPCSTANSRGSQWISKGNPADLASSL